jgi:hypothetical protein
MATPLDVQGTITLKTALVIVAIVAVGLIFVFSSLSAVGYVLLAVAAILYLLASFGKRSRQQ